MFISIFVTFFLFFSSKVEVYYFIATHPSHTRPANGANYITHLSRQLASSFLLLLLLRPHSRLVYSDAGEGNQNQTEPSHLIVSDCPPAPSPLPNPILLLLLSTLVKHSHHH